MNSVSWFFYLADLSSNLSKIAGIIFILSLIATGICGVIGGLMVSDGEEMGRNVLGHCKRAAILCFVASLFCAAIPEKKTIYLIAASQLGERIAQTPAANEIASDANEILRSYLKKLKDGLKEDSK